MKNWNKKDNYSDDIDYNKALKKKKLLKVINIISYILSGICIILLLIGCINSCSKKKEDNPQVNNVVERAPLNLAYFGDNDILYVESSDISVSFFDSLYEKFDTEIGENLFLEDVSVNISIVYQGQTINFDGFQCEIDDYPNSLAFNLYSIEAGFGSGEYYELNVVSGVSFFILYHSGSLINNDSIESLMVYENNNELYDIFANLVPVSYDEELFDAITDTVTNFIGTLSSGIASVLALFWANNQLTVLGTLTVIVVGVALVYFLLRFIIGLTRLRG